MTDPVEPPDGPQLPLVRDRATNEYVNKVGRQISSAADQRGIPYTFYVINSDVVNAFSIPGGYVYLNRGLVERADNVSQLAGVLAHQIAHNVERHGEHPTAAAEREADRAAISYAMRAGISPTGPVKFLDKVLALREQTPGKVEQWLSLHPITKERLQTIEALIAATPGAQGPQLITDTPEFQTFRDHLRTVTPLAEDR